MALFVINHELRQPPDRYAGLWSALEKRAALQVLESSWLIRATTSPTMLLDSLLPLVGQDDRLLVIQVSEGLAWANPMADPSSRI